MRHHQPNWERIGIAICVAPFATVIVNFIFCWMDGVGDPEPLANLWSECINVSGLVSLFTVPIAFVVLIYCGIPVHLFLLKRKTYGPLGYILLALVVAGVIQLITVPHSPFIAAWGLYAPHAIAVSLVAWFIAARNQLE